MALVVLDAHANDGTVTDFLDRLGARSPTPAGGSVAALCTAQAAALVAMVARYCEAEPLVGQAEGLVDTGPAAGRRRRAGVRRRGGRLGDPPRYATTTRRAASAIDEALLGAAEPQARVVETAIEVLVLIDQLRPSAGPGWRPTWSRPARWRGPAAAIARMNVQSNLRTLPDSDERSGLLRRMGVAQRRV